MAITEAAKVIIIIVEGDNDAELLQQYVDELTRHSRTQYHFEITIGDIFGDKNRRSKAPNTVQKQIKSVMDRQKYKKSDIEKVYQVVDIDGCFVKQGDFLVAEKDQSSTQHCYDFVHDKVMCASERHKVNLKQSWTAKQHRLLELVDINSVWSLPYALTYFSVTSEHVLSGHVKYVQDDKLDVVEQFTTEFPTVSAFIRFLDSNSLIDTTDSWQQLKQGNGFLRLTNINKLFQDIEKLVE
ncbi:hypothetical protein [Lactiplantibacillus pentosus]